MHSNVHFLQIIFQGYPQYEVKLHLLICSSVGWSRVNSPTSKMGHFSYVLGSKCVNFQKKISSDKKLRNVSNVGEDDLYSKIGVLEVVLCQMRFF